MKKQRKHYAAEEKAAILRRHLLDKEPTSKLCDELGLQPTVFYRWQKGFFENGASAFEQKKPTNHSAGLRRSRLPEMVFHEQWDPAHHNEHKIYVGAVFTALKTA
jgi:transposase